MRKLLGVVVALGLGGCASIISKSDWPVTFTSPEPVDITVTDENGVKRAAARTPTTIVLPSGDGWFDGQTYTIQSSYGPRVLTTRLNGWYLGNIVFGGALGLLVIDPATGAMWRLPDVFDVALLQAPPAAAPAAAE